MSVERVKRKRGVVWRVRWRDDSGKARSHICGSKSDAEVFDAEVTRRKRMGQLAHLDAGTQTVASFAEEAWWPTHVVPNLAPKTQEVYARLFDLHLLPRVGDMALRDVTAGFARTFALTWRRRESARKRRARHW